VVADSLLPPVTPDQAAPADVVPEPFDDFYRREYRALVALGIALVGDRGRAEEQAQDALLAAHRQWDRVSRCGSPAAWVRRAVINRAKSTWRGRFAEARMLDRVAKSATPSGDPAAIDRDRFWALVRALPARQAQCVTLHYLEELTTREIASVLGIDEATVRVHLHRGRASLARVLSLRLEEEDTP
jgi:RNA polymerase sigma factor (sigma-70 family)